MSKSLYTQTIRELLAKTGNLGIDPRHVEVYMRLEHSTLDGLSPRQFRSEVLLSVSCIEIEGNAGAERLAQSYGL